MKIYLMRHGIACEADGPSTEADSRRPLTTRGHDKIARIAHVLKKLDLKPDLILSSPYVRAEQTASIVAKIFDCRKNLRFSELLIPNGKAEAIISEIADNFMVNEIFIISHEPCLSLLICKLAALNLDISITMKKGGVCCLSAHDLRVERRASIEWLLPPKISLKV